MPPNMRMMKVPEYPRPHEMTNNFSIPVESAGARATTIYPLITQDEGLGAMSAYESNPANASFVEINSAHCFPTSRINKIFAKLEVSMSKVMLETDKRHIVKFRTALIHTSFMDGELALDEISTLDLNEILELQNEQTDRQTFPLYNAVDLHDYKANSRLDLSAEQLGLTADLEIEGVAFTQDDYYDCLHYFTNGAKLRTICTPLQTHVLTRQNPQKTIFFNQQSNTKYMNPYAFLGILIDVPSNANAQQYGELADDTVETGVLHFNITTRYNEFNHEFNHALL